MYPHVRKDLDATKPLYAARAFTWNGVELVPGDAFPADVPQHRLNELWNQHFIDHETGTRVAAPESAPIDGVDVQNSQPRDKRKGSRQ